jgi:hypothetical protein
MSEGSDVGKTKLTIRAYMASFKFSEPIPKWGVDVAAANAVDGSAKIKISKEFKMYLKTAMVYMGVVLGG